MVPTVATGQVARALSRFTSAFKNQPNCKAILAALVCWVPELENIFWQITASRILANNPTGDQLDEIGGLLGEPRAGRTDALYLPALLLRIRINRSGGRSEDVIQVSNLLAPGAAYDEYPNMHFLVGAWNIPDPNGFATMIGETKATGSHGVLHYSTWDPAVSPNLAPISRYASTPANATALTTRTVTPPANVGLPVASVPVSNS